MLTKTKAALAAALIIGSASLGAASAFAGGNSGEYTGGYVVPGAAGVNPVDHPGWFGRNSKGTEAFGLAVRTPARTVHKIAPEDNYGSEAGKE